MNKKGAYFFVVDAMVAGLVIVSTLYLIFSTYQSAPETNPSVRAMNDYVKFLTTTRIREYSGVWASDLVESGEIKNIDNTMIDQVMEWRFEQQVNEDNTLMVVHYEYLIGQFMMNASKGVISSDRSIEVILDGQQIYSKYTIPPSKAQFMIDNKRVVFKFVNDSNIFGPTILEVKIWS